MNYTTEFKEKVFRVLRFATFVDIPTLTKAMDNNQHTTVRLQLENGLDDPELYLKDKITDDGELIVANSKIHAYLDRRAIYSEFMEMYVQHLDELVPTNKYLHAVVEINNIGK